ATGTWRLECDARSFGGSLAPGADGLVAELPLSAIDVQADAWTWSARVERDGRELAAGAATLAVTLPPPHADAHASTVAGEAPLAVSFEDRTRGPVACTWDFGDGKGSSERAPLHTYTAPGTYRATLTVTNAAGTDAQTIEIAVREQDLQIRYGMNA